MLTKVEKIERLQDQILEKRSKIYGYEEKIKEYQKDINYLYCNLVNFSALQKKQAENRIDTLTDNINTISTKICWIEEEIESLKNNISEL